MMKVDFTRLSGYAVMDCFMNVSNFYKFQISNVVYVRVRVADGDIGAYYCTMTLANGDSLKHVVNLNGDQRTHTHTVTLSHCLSLRLSLCLSVCVLVVEPCMSSHMCVCVSVNYCVSV